MGKTTKLTKEIVMKKHLKIVNIRENYHLIYIYQIIILLLNMTEFNIISR